MRVCHGRRPRARHGPKMPKPSPKPILLAWQMTFNHDVPRVKESKRAERLLLNRSTLSRLNRLCMAGIPVGARILLLHKEWIDLIIEGHKNLEIRGRRCNLPSGSRGMSTKTSHVESSLTSRLSLHHSVFWQARRRTWVCRVRAMHWAAYEAGVECTMV